MRCASVETGTCFVDAAGKLARVAVNDLGGKVTLVLCSCWSKLSLTDLLL